MKKILTDTDVILDFFFDRKPYSDHATRLFTLFESGKMAGFITPVICSNVYYILRQRAQHSKVIEKLKQLMRIFSVIPMDEEIVLHALNSGFKDFEDALQNYAAIKTNEIDVILTRNVRDFRKSTIAVMTPESFLDLMK
jgi:predicted nucleic acid-binding protein